MSKPGTKIEEFLPKEFLLKQGIYVQTCAHLEMILWRVLRHAGDLNLDDEDGFHAAMTARKRNTELLKRMRRTLDSLSSDHASELQPILDQIESELFVRHMAVHGAWLQKGNIFRCEYYENKGTSKQPNWHTHDYDISYPDIDEAIQTVDGMLLRASKVWLELEIQNEKSPKPPVAVKGNPN